MVYNSTKYILFLFSLLLCNNAFSQIGIGTKTPDSKSIADINSTTRGLLIPRLSTVQLTTLGNTLTAAQKGMLVTDAASGKPVYWNGKSWNSIADISAKLPLIVSNTNQVSINSGTAAGDLLTWDGNNWINTQPAIVHFNIPVNNLQPYLVLNYCIALQGIFPARSGPEPFVSQIELFGFNFAPKGWAQCNGQLLPLAQNTALFSLLGTSFGGDGKTTFGLPNLQGKVPVSFGQGPGLSDYSIGEQGGTESGTLIK